MGGLDEITPSKNDETITLESYWPKFEEYMQLLPDVAPENYETNNDTKVWQKASEFINWFVAATPDSPLISLPGGEFMKKAKAIIKPWLWGVVVRENLRLLPPVMGADGVLIFDPRMFKLDILTNVLFS